MSYITLPTHIQNTADTSLVQAEPRKVLCKTLRAFVDKYGKELTVVELMQTLEKEQTNENE